MVSSITPEKVINALAAMVAAINNIRLYPPASGIIANSIEKAFSSIQNAFIPDEPLLIAESENNLLISGEALSFKNQQLPQVISFREYMSGLRIKSIILKKAAAKEEFKNLLMIMSKSPEDIDMEGGIQKVTSGVGFSSITITPKIFISGEQQDEYIGSLDTRDIEIIKTFLGERRTSEADFMRIGEKALDPRWVSDLFQSGISQIKGQGVTISDDLLPETVSKMIQAFEASTIPENRSRISASIADVLSEADNELFSVVMANNTQSVFFDKIINSLSNDQFVELFAKVSQIGEAGSYGNKKLSAEEISRFHKVFEHLKKHKKTPELREKIRQKIAYEKKKSVISKDHFEKGLKGILSGEQAPLSDELVMQSIPNAVKTMYRDGMVAKAQTVINRVADGLLNESLKTRTEVSQALLTIGEKFFLENKTTEISRIAHRLNIWLKFETEVTQAYEPVCKLLRNHTRHLLRENNFSEANTILETFSFIYYGRIQKNDRIKAMAGEALRDIARGEIFQLIFDEFKTDSHKEGKNAYYTLIRLGIISIEPLLDLLRISEDMSQRVRIMNALTEIGAPVLPVLIERLQHGSAWFYMRNLLKLLSQLGSEDQLEILTPMLNHENTKVPRAVLNCAFDIGGEKRFKFFINALNTTGEQLKNSVVDLLGKLNSDESVYPLTELLKSKATSSSELKNKLDVSICVALGKIGSKKAIPALNTIVKQKGLLGMRTYAPEVRSAAENTLKLLQNLPTKAELVSLKKHNNKKVIEEKVKSRDDLNLDELAKTPAQVETLVNQYIRQQKKPEAVRLLYKLIVKYAQEKNFTKADDLRSKLFEIDPMALAEIVKTGDIIEEEKSNSVVNEYMNIWGNLYERLTEEEANALFYAIKIEEFNIDETIIEQSKLNSKLCFINRGQLKVVYKQKSDDFFLKMIGAGDIAGIESFFPITVSTVSLVALSNVKVGFLERDILKSWKNKYPQLETKLHEYCTMGDGINELVKKKGLERRQQKRFDISGKALVQILDTSNRSMGKPFKGNLLDISEGGLSFVIKTPKKDTARLLLGRKLNMSLGIVTKDNPIEISHTGTIIGARDKKDSHFSIHLKFDSLMSKNKIVEIANYAVPE